MQVMIIISVRGFSFFCNDYELPSISQVAYNKLLQVSVTETMVVPLVCFCIFFVGGCVGLSLFVLLGLVVGHEESKITFFLHFEAPK